MITDSAEPQRQQLATGSRCFLLLFVALWHFMAWAQSRPKLYRPVPTSAHILEKVSCLSVCRRRKRRCARLFPSRSLSSWYRKGHVAIFPSSSLLHARTTRPISPCSPRFFVTIMSNLHGYNACIFNCSKI